MEKRKMLGYKKIKDEKLKASICLGDGVRRIDSL